jgi:hypothetical protein
MSGMSIYRASLLLITFREDSRRNENR